MKILINSGGVHLSLIAFLLALLKCMQTEMERAGGEEGGAEERDVQN